MKLHLVGGFLGSGKTTAIINAAKQLTAQGKRVGIITNDQGKYLVDTMVFELAHMPTVEVSGGCFCCNYNDLEARLDQLQKTARPDVIFAESVGSCADLVATVIKPLLKLRSGDASPSSLSVFTDSRLLRQWLQGQPLPFAENVVYIFEKQIEEAGLLVTNKIDLLDSQATAELMALARRRFPNKIIRAQNSLAKESVNQWLQLLNSNALSLPEQSLEIDYVRYGDGEAQLAWLDEEIIISTHTGSSRDTVINIVQRIVDGLDRQHIPTAHLKFLIHDDKDQVKVSFTGFNDTNWASQIPAFANGHIAMRINARVQTGVGNLRQLMQDAVANATAPYAIVQHPTGSDVFHPGFPRPTHRIE